MDMKKFVAMRQLVIDCYRQLESLSAMLGNENVQRELLKAEKFLMADNFKLVVIGEFSRGKSTFINALIGKKILPAKSVPTTAMINRISYGESEKFVLHYRDDTPSREIDEAEFKSIVAENFDAAQTSRIAYAEIRYPLEICRNGVELIDTPGTNDLDQVREEITFKFIPEADAAIFLLSAAQILSRNEIDFLKNRVLKNDISKIFFVINFKDWLENPAVDAPKILRLAERELKKFIPTPRIYILSSKLALNFRLVSSGEKLKGKVPANFEDTGFGELERDLAAYLVQEKSADKLKKYISRAVHLGDELIAQTIHVEKSTLGITSAQLQRQIELFKPQLDKLKRDSQRVFENLRVLLQSLAQNFTMMYEMGLGNIARRAQSTINSYAGELRAESITRAIESAVAPLQQENEIALRNKLYTRIEVELQKVCESLQKIFREKIPAQSFTLAPISMDNGALFGLEVKVPFIAIPLAMFGGKNFLRQFENYRRENFLTNVSVQIRQRYAEIIPAQVQQFETALNNQLANLARDFEEEISGKISEVEVQLNRLLAERSKAALDENFRRAALDALEENVRNIQGKLTALL